MRADPCSVSVCAAFIPMIAVCGYDDKRKELNQRFNPFAEKYAIVILANRSFRQTHNRESFSDQ